jgi:hypothetical protein
MNLGKVCLILGMLSTACAECPGSPSYVHAACEMAVKFSDTCESVHREIMTRVGQQGLTWTDPHNNGTYSVMSETKNRLELSRLTGDGAYTDLMIFAFLDTPIGGCIMEACSESQVFSVVDFSTNYCNLHDLYCSEYGCRPFSKLTYTESYISCAQRMNSCLTV